MRRSPKGARGREQVSALAAAIAAAGCVVVRRPGEVLAAAGLTEAEGAAAIDVLASEGRIRPDGAQVLKLVGGVRMTVLTLATTAGAVGGVLITGQLAGGSCAIPNGGWR